MSDLKQKRVGVLMGGLSREREISLKSGRGVAAALRRRGYTVVEIDADRQAARKIEEAKIEAAVIMLHGRFGEDGTIQGMLEVMGIPYSGSGPLASAVAMDKDLTKRLVREGGIMTPPWRMIPSKNLKRFAEPVLPLPVVVKPNREGSTLGVSIVTRPSEWVPALEKAASLDDWILAEDFVRGREITVGLLDGKGLPLIEIVPKSGFFDFDAKYTKGMTEYLVPARVPEEVRREMTLTSEKIFDLLKLEGVARIDFMLDKQAQFLEVNTIPGMTETSLVPMAARSVGIEYDDLCERIVLGASLKI